ncbi:MAG: hypothetical protein WCL11_08365 [Verrucomicrobiota bacterium]
MELFISKLCELDLPPVANLLQLIASPATVKLHKGFFPAVLRQVANQALLVGLRFRYLVGAKVIHLAVPETTPAPDV